MSYRPLGPTMTHEEIAKALGTTREAVKQLERSALRKVRQALGIDTDEKHWVNGKIRWRKKPGPTMATTEEP